MGKFKIALLLTYICIAAASAGIITPALPQIEHAYLLTHGALEWVISIFLLGYVIGHLIYAPLANHDGRLCALRCGLVINIVGILLCLISVWFWNYGVLLLGRLVTAMGAAAGLSCTFILINELLPKEQARAREVLAMYKETGGPGMFGAATIEATLREADEAVASGDIVAMLGVYNRLRDVYSTSL